MESLPDSIRGEVFSDENEQVFFVTEVSQKCEISPGDVPLMKGKADKMPPGGPRR